MKKVRKIKKPLAMEQVDINTIQPHPKNARKHGEENIQAIMASLKQFGQRTPLVVGRDNNILKGNGTYEAMVRLGFHKIAILRARLSPNDEMAYLLADNKTGDSSEFDFQEVSEILGNLNAEDYDLSATGFTDFEINPLLEASWNPGDESPMPGLDDEDKPLVIKFSPQQAAKVARAIELSQTVGDNPNKADQAECLVKILEIYSWYHATIGGPGVTNPHEGQHKTRSGPKRIR